MELTPLIRGSNRFVAEGVSCSSPGVAGTVEKQASDGKTSDDSCVSDSIICTSQLTGLGLHCATASSIRLFVVKEILQFDFVDKFNQYDTCPVGNKMVMYRLRRVALNGR